MCRPAIGLICVIAALMAGCTSASHGTQAARNPARWAINVPPGWHIVRFSDSKNGVRAAGIQISNVRLPAPALLPGTPVEINGKVLPPRGVGLVIATAAGLGPVHGQVAGLPLPLPWPYPSHEWLLGSPPLGTPVYEWLWFRTGGTMYVAVVTIGTKASMAVQRALGPIVRSVKPEPATRNLPPCQSCNEPRVVTSCCCAAGHAE